MRPLIAALLLTSTLFAADLTAIPHLPAGLWRVDAGADDQATLSTQGQVLVMDYDVNVRDWHQIGHQSLKQASLKLLLKQPVPLTKETARIVFEAWGHGKGSWQTQDRQTQLRPLLRDANGEWLSYTSYPYPHLKHGATTWARWMSNAFYACEAGGATQDVFEAWGGDGNAWPDGTLSFAGFELTVRLPEFGRTKGRVAIGEIAAAPTRLPYEPPYAYVDSLVPGPGTYRLAASISQGYQHPPLLEQDSTITLVPNDLDSARQKVAFTLGSDGPYWITWQLTDADGKPVAGDTMRYRVLNNPISKDLMPVSPEAVPVMGYLRVNWAGHVGGVYERGEPMAVQVRVFHKDAQGPLTVDWQLLQSRYDAVLQSGTVAVPAGGAYKDLTITPAWQDNRDAYRLKLTLKAGGKTIDQTTYELGRKTDRGQSLVRPGMIFDRDYVKQGTYFRMTYLTVSTDKFASEDEALAKYVHELDEMIRMCRYVTYMIDLRNLEVLPGVFDFSLLDRIMDASADRGVALTIRYSHADERWGPYTWHPYYRQYNYDGTEIYMHYYGGFSLVDKQMTDFWHRAYKATWDRYHNHPGFQGYYLMEPAGESTVADKPWEGVIAGYDPPMTAAFQQWLRDHEKLSLETLNKRWGTSFAAWADVTLPMPKLELGAMPDLRMQWVDFNRFKAWLDSDGWLPVASSQIRTYDDNHVIIAYGAPNHLPKEIDFGHNGGNHRLILEGQLEEPWLKNHTGWINEPHHPHRWAAYGDPAEKGWVLDWTVWVSTAQSGAGGQNFHVYYDPRPGVLEKRFGTDFAFDRLWKYQTILQELHGIELVKRPFAIATLQDPYTLYCKHRTTFTPRAEDLSRWFERLKDDSVPYEAMHADELAKYKLVLPNLIDTVMSEENIMAVDTAVREHGAKLIIAARTGCYCPERGDQPFQLLRQLGIKPPTSAYKQDQQNITANVSAHNPLFADGGEVAFFTLADLKRDLQSKLIRDSFWKYSYRWIPQTDYFGVYEGHQPGGDTWATFPGGGAAVSHHRVGKGEVVVFWGVPDFRLEKMGGFMAKAAKWAGVVEPAAGAPIPRMIEAIHPTLDRRYVLLFHETPGTYSQPFPATPDGSWFVTELVADRKLGTWTGEELRTGKLPVVYEEGFSPLKIFRLTPAAKMKTKWAGKYRLPEQQ